VAEALAGDFSPGGRLPVTFYKSVDQLPPFDDYSLKGRTYRYFTGEPLYPFGYGLSYTTFSYSRLDFDKKDVGANDSIVVSIDVKNLGAMAGDEVVQVYFTHRGVEGAPLRSLVGFERVHLQPGATQTVRIAVDNRQLSLVNAAGERRIVPGEVEVWVGGGQPVERAGLSKPAGVRAVFRITGEANLSR
jgi:beta-glucosidase